MQCLIVLDKLEILKDEVHRLNPITKQGTNPYYFTCVMRSEKERRC